MAKHSLAAVACTSTAKHHKSGIDPKCEDKFPSLKESEKDRGMFCQLCQNKNC